MGRATTLTPPREGPCFARRLGGPRWAGGGRAGGRLVGYGYAGGEVVLVDVPARDKAAIAWLLECGEPAVRFLTRRDLLGEPGPADAGEIMAGPWMTALLSGQRDGGGFGGHPYNKWGGAHWRLVSLVELGIPAGEPRALAAAETVLAWLISPGRLKAVQTIDGRARRCASQEGNALAVCSRLGMADDPRVRQLAELLICWQWPDGGWNCDRRPATRRSSVHESLPPLWGLHEYAAATGDRDAARAAGRTAEMLLARRVYQAQGGREPLHPSVAVLHYPPYWHYDVLQALQVLGRMGLAGDPRTADAVDLLRSKQLPDGRWRTGAHWWSRPGSKQSADVVDWGRRGPNVMVTLNALRALRAAGAIGASC
jgi:hypothetical protein